jgi:hypothetical protein
MNEEYKIGVELALKTMGLTKQAGLPMGLVNRLRAAAAHPVTIGAGLGAVGGLLSVGEEPLLHRVLQNAAMGGVIGAGIKYLPKYTDKTMPGHVLAKDIPWLAPSLLAPALVSRMSPRKS